MLGSIVLRGRFLEQAAEVTTLVADRVTKSRGPATKLLNAGHGIVL